MERAEDHRGGAIDSSQSLDFSRPPPMTIWDLLQLMFVVGLFSAIVRPLLDKNVGAITAFTGILAVDLAALGLLVAWFQWSARAAQARAVDVVASLSHTREHIHNRRLAYFITLLASFPYQAILLAFAANFRGLGPVVVGLVLGVHFAVAAATLHYWRVSRRRGAVFCEKGILLHGSQFLPWRRFGAFRYSEVRERLVLYEKSRMRFHYYEFNMPPEKAAGVLALVRKCLRETL